MARSGTAPWAALKSSPDHPLYMYSLPESLAIVGTAVFAWWALHHACAGFWHRPWIANAGFGALIVIGALLSLVDELRKRREARRSREAHQRVQIRYPMCRATRLPTGNWFLTDRATGCEYAAPREEAADA